MCMQVVGHSSWTGGVIEVMVLIKGGSAANLIWGGWLNQGRIPPANDLRMQPCSTVVEMSVHRQFEKISIPRPSLRGAGNINLLASPVESGSFLGYPDVVPSHGQQQPQPPITSRFHSPSFKRTKQAAPYAFISRLPQSGHFFAGKTSTITRPHSEPQNIGSGNDIANIMSRPDNFSAQATPELISMDSAVVPSPPPQTPPHTASQVLANPQTERQDSPTSASITNILVHAKRSKSYVCPYPGCGKEFTQLYNVKPHFLLHSNLRPYACTSCDASFARSTDLARHFKTVHKGFKEYQCRQCGDGFSRKDSLVRHGRSCGGPLPHE